MAFLGSLVTRITRFANSPQGRQAVAKATDYAQRPETKAKIEQVRQKVVGQGRKTRSDDPQEPQSKKRSGTN